MPRTRVKICGVTRPQDAEAAAIAGADAIGMIFHPSSPRNISPDRARMIMHVLPPFVTAVGVFVDAEPQDILDTAAELGLRNVQLNGEQSAEEIAELEGLLVIKSLRVDRTTLRRQMEQFRQSPPANLVGFVLEPANTSQPGGSGVANNWAVIADEIAAGTFANMPPIIAAGGLNPDNVAGVVQQIHPFAVDVSSGVEESLGVKSSEKIERFVREVRRAESAT